MFSFLNQPPRERVLSIAIAAAIGVAVLFALNRDPAEASGEPAPSLDALIPLDPEVRTDTLENGLRFYVRANHSPAKRAELRLVVNAGSVLEQDDQRGLAHAVEHMAFRGTRRFPGNRVIDYLESIGMRSGYDVNATTSFDETVYDLTIPTERPASLDTAVAILADWAHAVTFDTAEARREAGVVFEEWRLGVGASERLLEARDTLLLSGSRYAKRFPIGDTLVLRRFDVGAMRRFYQEWYRPELMAVVAVGDFDADKVESLIREEFGVIDPSKTPKRRPDFPVSPAFESRASIFTDPEARGTRVALWYPRPRMRPRTNRDYRALLIESLSRSLLNDRLDRLAELPNAPLLNAGVSVRSMTRFVEAHTVGGTAIDGELSEAVGALSEEVARLQRFGATTSELDRAKESLLSARRKTEAFGENSEDIADALTWNFLDGQPVAGAAVDYELTKSLLRGIDSSHVAQFARQFSLDSGSAIVVSTDAGSRTARAQVTPGSLIATARAGAERAADTYRDSTDIPALIDQQIQSGTIVTERVFRNPDAFEWILSNGMRVIVKPTTYASEILLRATAPGGASLAAASDYPSAYFADQIIEATGIGPVSGARLAYLLGQNSISLAPTVTDDWVQLSGSAMPRDMETLFQLTHLYFTQPRADSTAFGRYRSRIRTYARNREADPDAAFDDSVKAALRPNDPRALEGSRGFVEEIKLDVALRFWRARVANATNFTVVLVGDFSLEGVRPLVVRYLASLPAGQRETSREIAQPPLPGVVQRSFHRGGAPKARTQIVFSDRTDLTPAADATLHLTEDVLTLILESRLREALGGTYGVSVDLGIRPASRSRVSMSIDFSAAPERVDSLAATAVAEIRRLCTAGPSKEEVAKVKAAADADLETEEDNNNWWLRELTWHTQLGWPIESINAHREAVDHLSASGLREACQRHLDTARYVRVTMRPEARAR